MNMYYRQEIKMNIFCGVFDLMEDGFVPYFVRFIDSDLQ